MTSRYASRKAAAYVALQGLRAAFGGAVNAGLSLIVVFVIVSIGWFGDTLYALMTGGPASLVGLVPFLLVVLLFVVLTRVSPVVAPEIRQYSSRPARALIWFLSPPGSSAPTETDPDRMHSWRMAFEAIQSQWVHGGLERVVVIPSANTSGDRQDGSFRYWEHFRDAMAAATGLESERFMLVTGHARGVNFEDAAALYEAIEETFGRLAEMGIRADDVLLDVTGGQKLPAVLGGIASLVEGRRFQYVSTRDMKVHEYNITYRAAG